MIEVTYRQKYWDYAGEKRLPTNYCVVEVIKYKDNDDLIGEIIEVDEFVPTKYVSEVMDKMTKKYKIVVE